MIRNNLCQLNTLSSDCAVISFPPNRGRHFFYLQFLPAKSRQSKRTHTDSAVQNGANQRFSSHPLDVRQTMGILCYWVLHNLLSSVLSLSGSECAAASLCMFGFWMPNRRTHRHPSPWPAAVQIHDHCQMSIGEHHYQPVE